MNGFKTMRYGRLGERKLRLVRKGSEFFGMADGKVCTQGSDADDVWQRLQDDAGKSDPSYFGYEGARARFRAFFPEGFGSQAYLADERNYKVKAREMLNQGAPLSEAREGRGLGEAVLGVFRATNLLASFEMMRVQDLLRGCKADAFVQAAARFAESASASTLSALERALKADECAKWTVATYLPYLWRPDVHMFLKPVATKDFAARVGHRFASVYTARLEFDVYEALCDLAGKTEKEVTELSPQDRIDVQSFIWVVGNYRQDQRSG